MSLAMEKKIVHSEFKDLVPLRARKDYNDDDDDLMDRPSEEEVRACTERTRAALEKITQGKIAASQPKNVKKESKEPTYIRYTPQQQGASFNSGAKQRIIRMVEMQSDPLEPPQFKHKKIPRGPPSPPAPVLHSPPRKISAKEQQEWVIPPCISNWKNAKGYTIPLDKRLAADGRGLQEVQINDKFANFAEALFAADRHAREEVRQRNLMQQKLAQKEKAAKEEHLRMLAQKAREERAGISRSAEDRSDEDEDDASVREREELRRERQRQRERELRMSKMGSETRAKVLAREQGRDISEKIALGTAKPTVSRDTMYDARLFNQSSGLGSGFKDDEAYDVYDKPLFSGGSNSLYRFRKTEDEEGGTEEDIQRQMGNDRFGLGGSTRSFQGADRSQPREGPVQFEKEEADPFGIDQLLDSVRKGKRGLEEAGESSNKRSRD
ncbi:uncharacterized protein VTP21DRAFT_5826 [Calcarisporiella thermophila]|uniref:uncharacterized protein n=1 Tax=Calcarisporiella thermophila TaxID=911321 RepID=UPI00374232E6